MEKGSAERKAILAGIKTSGSAVAKQASSYKVNERDYLKHPSVCPYCGSYELEVKAFNTTSRGKGANQAVECDNCEANWTALWTLTGFYPNQEPQVDVEDLGEPPEKGSAMYDKG